MDLEARLRAWQRACRQHQTAANARAAVQAGGGGGAKGGGAKGGGDEGGGDVDTAPLPPRPRPRVLPSHADLRTVSFWLAAMQLIGIFVSAEHARTHGGWMGLVVPCVILALYTCTRRSMPRVRVPFFLRYLLYLNTAHGTRPRHPGVLRRRDHRAGGQGGAAE